MSIYLRFLLVYQESPEGIYDVNLINNSMLIILTVTKHNGDIGGVQLGQYCWNTILASKNI